jgi:hypothetical protein
MAKKRYPAYWQQWIGKLAIKCETPFHRPEVVYATHVTRGGLLSGKTLNSGVVLFARPSQLVEYTPRLFAQLDAIWLRRDALRRLEHANKCLMSATKRRLGTSLRAQHSTPDRPHCVGHDKAVPNLQKAPCPSN